MNVERLHVIAKALQEDLRRHGLVNLMEQLHNALNQYVSQPQVAGHQQQVSTLRGKIKEALEGSSVNKFPPTWLQALDELGIAPLLGQKLSDEIENIFNENQITPAAANQEIEKLFKQLQALNTALEQLATALQYFKIGSEDLEPGDCELGILIPRTAVDDSLPDLGRELARLQRIFEPFQEIATGSREGFKVRTIASTDFSIFTAIDPATAALMAVALERIVKFYKTILEIRLLRKQLKDQDLPEDILDRISNHVNKLLDEKIPDLVEDLLKTHSDRLDDGRIHELRTETRRALKDIANRIDRGYNIDVRCNPPEQEEEEPEGEDGASPYRVIEGASKELKFMNLTGEPVLGLPDPKNDEEQDRSRRH